MIQTLPLSHSLQILTCRIVEESHEAACEEALWKVHREWHSEVTLSESCMRSRQVPQLGFGFGHLPRDRFATFLSVLRHLNITGYFNREPINGMP